MESTIIKISSYNDKKLKNYLETTSLKSLHKIKLYLDDIYYNTGETSTISDYQYDILKDTLIYRDPEYVPPIGTKIRKGENRVKIPYHMGSMDKFKPKDIKELQRWLIKNKSKEYIIEDKLDGVSCLLLIKDKKIKLYTRGDGIIGADISYLSQYFKSIPKNININTDIVVRGELIMKEAVFKEKYSEDYANPRNMVSGRIGGKTIRKGIRDIEFVAYELIKPEKFSPEDQFDFMDDLGFNVVNHTISKSITTEELIEFLINHKKNSVYEIDGIIVQPNTPYKRNKSGNPSYAFAFKMLEAKNIKQTVVQEVEWNVSKWGILKPRIRVEPVSLGGVTISYTTGFNGKYIMENSIGPGAVINITRSGDVIPYIVEVLEPAETPQMPDVPYTWNETGVDISTESYNNIACIKRLASFFSKIGVKHVSEATITKLYNQGYDTFFKIIELDVEGLMKIEGIGEKGAIRIHKNIENALKNSTVPELLGSSGIFGFGIGRKRIISLMTAIPDILEIQKSISEEELKTLVKNVEGFSEKTAEKIIDNIHWAE